MTPPKVSKRRLTAALSAVGHAGRINKTGDVFSIILLDDYVMFRQGIRKIIEESEDMAVVGEASSGVQLRRLLKEAVPDMVIIDISMPDLGGIDLARELKKDFPEVKILVLGTHTGREHVRSAFSAGADGCLGKEDTGEELFRAIEAIRNGSSYISPLLSREVAEDVLAISRAREKKSGSRDHLTRREREVLSLVAEGRTSKQIADMLFISRRTVEHHRASISKKVKAKNVADLIKYAVRNGYASVT